MRRQNNSYDLQSPSDSKTLITNSSNAILWNEGNIFNKKIDLSRFSPVNCPYESVFKGAVSGAWPDKLSINIGTPRQVLFTTWRDELKSFERAPTAFAFSLFLKLGSQACARTSTFCRPVSRYSIALNNLTIEERNNPV